MPRKKYFIIVIILAAIIILSFTAVGIRQYFQRLQKHIETLTAEAHYFKEFADVEAKWLMSTQLENGALPFLPNDNGEVYINPYFSCYAALALVDYDSDESLKAAKSYMKWHFSHMNLDTADQYGLQNTICDYVITLADGNVVSENSTGNYDSADSYAALILTLLCNYSQASQNTDFANEYYYEFTGAISVLENLMHEGLTYTTPEYPVSYLMDNCEVYRGLHDAAVLMETIYLPISKNNKVEYASRRNLYLKILSLRDEVYTSIENILWNDEDEHYEFAIQEGNFYFGFDWNILYPDAYAQLSPITSGVIEFHGERAAALYSEFCQHHNWQKQSMFITNESLFYWSSITYAAAIVGDRQSVAQYFDEYRLFALPERTYPFYNSDSASILSAAIVCANNCLSEANELDPLNFFTDRNKD